MVGNSPAAGQFGVGRYITHVDAAILFQVTLIVRPSS